MSVNTELQSLVVKLGGESSDQDSNSDLVAKLNAAFTGQILVVKVDPACDRTAKEIFKAIRNGSIVFFERVFDDGIEMFPCVSVTHSDDSSAYDFYVFEISSASTFAIVQYHADDDDAYPQIAISGDHPGGAM